MIPVSDFEFVDLIEEQEPSLTYRLDLTTGRIGGMIDNSDAIVQAALKILSTERYSAVIYSGEYGVELERLIGKDMGYVQADLERTLTEALTADDRILGIEDFEIKEINRESMTISFLVRTVIELLPIETEVLVV